MKTYNDKINKIKLIINDIENDTTQDPENFFKNVKKATDLIKECENDLSQLNKTILSFLNEKKE